MQSSQGSAGFRKVEAETLGNVAQLLAHAAAQVPDQVAVAVADSGWRNPTTRQTVPETAGEASSSATSGPPGWRTISFAHLDQQATAVARGLLESGIPAGTRLALMVRPGIEFITLVFGLMRAGMVQVLIDPGMGRSAMLRCLAETQPEGFVAIPLAQALRLAFRRHFPRAVHNVTVGRRWMWGGPTYRQVLELGRRSQRPIPPTSAADPAAIIFTTGSTGPPKGVFYSHGMFIAQATQIRDYYQIEPGGVDLSGFPLFALFNSGMGTTTVIPRMDFTRPAEVDPRQIIGAVQQWQANQSFGSPALWNTVSIYCEKRGIRLPSLQRVFSAGAPVPPHVLSRVRGLMALGGVIHTPYGATEALPIASNDSETILGETAAATAQGRGVCVGARFPGIRWKVIRISDQALPDLEMVEELPPGEIGELMVSGSVVSPRYVTRQDANPLHKVRDPADDTIWHRMGDVGYLDSRDRFWFCGRKGQRVETERGTLFTIPVEAIFNQHPAVYRSALVGVRLDGGKSAGGNLIAGGDKGWLMPVLVLEPWPEQWPTSTADRQLLIDQVRSLGQQDPNCRQIEHFLLRKRLPVDIRHNSKIFREKLAVWASRQRLGNGK